ncbi:Ig-like domain-containing protein, partial [Streptomyces jeddahensis]|uniref:Ig-like domain-containing protein n=1 Tax=Streptomyces jeddahensis TaxID=1716141 RepID=UPI000AFD3528
ITYTPDPGFVGTDTFTYTISDGQGGQDTATVTITVTPALADTGAAVPLSTVAALGVVMLGLGVGFVLAARRSACAV